MELAKYTSNLFFKTSSNKYIIPIPNLYWFYLEWVFFFVVVVIFKDCQIYFMSVFTYKKCSLRTIIKHN